MNLVSIFCQWQKREGKEAQIWMHFIRKNGEASLSLYLLKKHLTYTNTHTHTHTRAYACVGLEKSASSFWSFGHIWPSGANRISLLSTLKTKTKKTGWQNFFGFCHEQLFYNLNGQKINVFSHTVSYIFNSVLSQVLCALFKNLKSWEREGGRKGEREYQVVRTKTQQSSLPGLRLEPFQKRRKENLFHFFEIIVKFVGQEKEKIPYILAYKSTHV